MVPGHLDLVGVLGYIPHCQLSTMEFAIVHFNLQCHCMGVSPPNRNDLVGTCCLILLVNLFVNTNKKINGGNDQLII
jgi:hypothetical protein